jgi:hypothetical protein
MKRCKCGSYAINDDPKEALCDLCWRDVEICRLQAIESALHDGMSLRDYFAGQALTSFDIHSADGATTVANAAYVLADAMLAAREKETK